MNKLKELFKSKIFIFLFSMTLGLIMNSIMHFQPNTTTLHVEFIMVPILGLLWGPIGISGYLIAELIHLQYYYGNTQNNIIIIISMFIASMMVWKLWYSIMHKYGHEIPNLSRFYNIIKLFAIFTIYFILIFIMIENPTYVSPIYEDFMISLVVLFATIFMISPIVLYIINKFKIPLYVPKKQMKSILPEKAYTAILILGIIISYLFYEYANIIMSIAIIVYLAKPYDEEVFKINDTSEITLFNKFTFSIFSLSLIISFILMISIYVDYSLNNIPLNFDEFMVLVGVSDYGYYLVFAVLNIAYLYFLERNIIKPIKNVHESMPNIENNSKIFNKGLDSVKMENEIKTLTESLLKMEDDLTQYKDELIEITSQKERYETELRLARDIQKSLIPTNFEEFNNENQTEIWGLLEPSHEVAWNFYDYFKIDEKHIGVTIGEVSGKGIGSSLIMVKTMTLIQDYVQHYEDLSKVFYEVNNLLCEGNVGELVVTCWFGKLNTDTGELNFVNAGHNSALIRQNNKEYVILEDSPDLELANTKNTQYQIHKHYLNKEDTIFLCSDGLTNANNADNEIYGGTRLRNILNKLGNAPLNEITNRIGEDVDRFCDNQKQSDDISIITIRMK